MNDQSNSVVPGPAASDQNILNTPTTAVSSQQQPNSWAPDLDRLASALSVLDPDCDDYKWKFGRIAPMANTAKTFPEQAEGLYKLAVAWSRGDLQANPSKKWVTPGDNGKSGRQVFNRVWGRFLNGTFTGRPATLGTIYHEARTAGWAPPEEQFEGAVEELE